MKAVWTWTFANATNFCVPADVIKYMTPGAVLKFADGGIGKFIRNVYGRPCIQIIRERDQNEVVVSIPRNVYNMIKEYDREI